MDEITKDFLLKLSAKYPGRAVSLTRQFLDGSDGRACGFVPNEVTGAPIHRQDVWYGDYAASLKK